MNSQIMNNAQLIPATVADHATVQNMARFYVYDMSRYCGFISDEWAIPADGLYESYDFKSYFEDPTRKAFLVKVDDELAGFVLLKTIGILPETEWHMGEFFILAKFQGKGIGGQVASQVWNMHPGIWEVLVIPENKSALAFWRKTIAGFTSGGFKEEIKTVDFDRDQPKRYIFSFDSTPNATTIGINPIIRKADISDVPAMVALSYEKRMAYEKAQPQFWRHADGAEEEQTVWFKVLMALEDHILFIAESDSNIAGFVIGKIVKAPGVYDPGGLTLVVDDFCVSSPALWQSVGSKLLNEIKQLTKAKGTTQILVVCGVHDEPKKRFLQHFGLNIASEWYVGDI